MDPVQVLDDYIARYETEEKIMVDEMANIDADIARAIAEVSAAQATLEKVHKRKAKSLKSWNQKKAEHVAKMEELHVKTSPGEPVPKKQRMNDDEKRVDYNKKKYEMLTRFEKSKRPMMTTEQIKTRIEELRLTAQELQAKTGLCLKKCELIAKLELGNEYPQTRKILTQMINDEDAAGVTLPQSAVPAATPAS